MTYSLDLRLRVVAHVKSGGSKASASDRFGVSLWCVDDWCRRGDLDPKPYTRTRSRKMDWGALRQHVQEHPDALLRERAAHFGVRIHAIEYALKRMGLRRKKNTSLRRKGS